MVSILEREKEKATSSLLLRKKKRINPIDQRGIPKTQIPSITFHCD